MTGETLALIITSTGAPLGGIAVVVTAWRTTGVIGKKVDKVNAAVHTQNGQPLGVLAENQEARWIEANVKPEHQTADERGYLERKLVNGNVSDPH